MARWLVIIGAIVLAAGLIWPWLTRLGLGHLPGDIWIRGERFSFYFPITTSIVISLVVSLFLWMLGR